MISHRTLQCCVWTALLWLCMTLSVSAEENTIDSSMVTEQTILSVLTTEEPVHALYPSASTTISSRSANLLLFPVLPPNWAKNCGAALYFDYINLHGGVHGRKIFLLSLDDGYEPERTIANTRQLIEQDRVFSLFGYVGTPTSKAALPLFNEAKIPFFAPFTGAELLRDPFNPYVFNVRASYYQETEALVAWLFDKGIKNIAVFHQDDSYGRAGLSGVQRALEKRRLSVSGTATVQRNSADVEAAVKRLSALKPGAIIMISAYASCAEFIRQAKNAGLDSYFLNVSFVGSKSLATDLWTQGRGVIVSQVVPFPVDDSISVVKEYQETLQFFSSQSPISYVSLEGFIAAKVFVEGLRAAGRNLTRNGFRTGLESLSPIDVGGFRLEWSAQSHAGADFVDITVIGEQRRWLY